MIRYRNSEPSAAAETIIGITSDYWRLFHDFRYLRTRPLNHEHTAEKGIVGNPPKQIQLSRDPRGRSRLRAIQSFRATSPERPGRGKSRSSYGRALVGANDIATDNLGGSQSADNADERDGPVA